MKQTYFSLIKTNLGKAAGSPFTALKLVWRRLFPFGIKPKDMEAYRIGSWSYGNLPRKSLTEIFPGIETADITIYKAFDRDITTSVDPLEILTLCAVAKHFNCKSILEIGTFNGNTTLNLAAATNENGKVTTIDLPEDWNGKYEINVPGIYVNVTDRKTVGAHYKQYPAISAKITQVFGDSAGLDYSKLSTPFDFAFIDGNHHYDYVRIDTENVLKNLSLGGIIAWHDYGMIEDVSRAVDEYAQKLDIAVVSGTRIAIARKK